MQQVFARIELAILLAVACIAPYAPSQDPAPEPDGAESRPELKLDREDPLGDLSVRMQVITKHLYFGETGKTVQPKEVDAIEQLDALIAVLKKKSGS
jgi:hypothetical protein